MIIGITGGIGTGKSTVLNVLKERYGFIIFEADKIAKEIMKKGCLAYNRIVRHFGKDILAESGEIDNKKMSETVFNDKEKLKLLNDIVHPSVIEEMQNRIKEYEKEGKDRFVIEAALLIESGCNKICDMVWYIYADEETRIKRLVEGRGMNREQILKVIENQLDTNEFKKNTDAVIDNSKSIEDTIMQVEKLLEF